MNPVTRNDVLDAIVNWKVFASAAVLPTQDKEEWNRRHTCFILGVVLPALRPPLKVYRIAVEAYLADEESQSDGSTLVPDELRYGNIKDWQGVMHDYIFKLHREKRTDAFGHEWHLMEANNAYRLGWIADGQWIRGNAWWLGLAVGSWYVWNQK